jgi:signal transduction histidine kinase
MSRTRELGKAAAAASSVTSGLASPAREPTAGPGRAHAHPASPNASGGESLRVLLIEDSPICQEATASALTEWGHSVLSANDGQAGLAALGEGGFDIVILDLGLPDMEYADVLEGIRARAGDIPVILLSGETRSSALFDAIHRGVFDFVSKGEHASLLEAAVGRAAQRLRLEKENEELLRRLRQLAGSLETQVLERTRALAEANQRLQEEMAERQRVEAELRLAQKLEAVGQLAAGIAHEINTPAQFVGDSVHFLAESFRDAAGLVGKYRDAVARLTSLPGHAELAREIREAEDAVDLNYVLENAPAAFDRALDGLGRISAIVGAMKEFAHPDTKEQTAADLNRALQATLTIAHDEYKYVADLETELAELPPVMCHLGDINQVFLNLVVNAAHAIAEVVGTTGQKGVIRVVTRRDGPMVRIDIADTGCGIPEAIRGRIFDPFFTTKPVGRGTGQGLPIARSIVVDKHCGTLTFSTAVGRGTTFTVSLPIDGRSVAPVAPERGSFAGVRR